MQIVLKERKDGKFDVFVQAVLASMAFAWFENDHRTQQLFEVAPEMTSILVRYNKSPLFPEEEELFVLKVPRTPQAEKILAEHAWIWPHEHDALGEGKEIFMYFEFREDRDRAAKALMVPVPKPPTKRKERASKTEDAQNGE